MLAANDYANVFVLYHVNVHLICVSSSVANEPSMYTLTENELTIERLDPQCYKPE